MYDHRVFFGTTIEQSSLCYRLLEELFEASREFRQNPRQYLTSAIRGDGAGGRRRQSLLKIGLATGLVLYSAFFLTLLILWTINTTQKNPVGNDTGGFIWMPRVWSAQAPPEVKKADKDSTSKGGGGGGDESPTPASKGEAPPFSPEQPLNAPTTRPTLKPPALPMEEILLGNPANNLKRDELAPTGLVNGVPGPPSDGFGKNDGIGTGNRGGVGPGKGPGFGPGEDGGQGNGKYNGEIDGKRPDGTGAGRVDTRPVALNKPRPNYTEEARKNKVQGTVSARLLVGADGLVKRVQIRGAGLADGLNDEAIRAASQMRFRPAMKDGQAVAYWVVIEIEFNIR